MQTQAQPERANHESDTPQSIIATRPLSGFRQCRKFRERGEAMESQANFVERREHPRVGVMAQVEDITYSVLRKHGVVSGSGRDAVSAKATKE